MSASAEAPYSCGEYPVALLDLPATVKKELVAYRAARDRQQREAALAAIERAVAAADAAGCRRSLHFAAVLVDRSECTMGAASEAHRALQYCNEALALLQSAPSLPPILRSVHCRALISRTHALGMTGRDTEAVIDAQQAAALAVTPWDKVHAFDMLVSVYSSLSDEQGLRLRAKATAQLEAAVAACEAAGVPSTDEVLLDGTNTVWTMKFQKAYSEKDHAAALACARKLRAMPAREGYSTRNDFMYMLGDEAEELLHLGRAKEAMVMLVRAVHSLKSAVEGGDVSVLSDIASCVNACAVAGQSALAHSFLRTAEGIVKSARESPKYSQATGNGMMRQLEGIIDSMKVVIAQLDGDTAGATAHKRSIQELRRQLQRMCCAEGCANSFQANGDKLLMCSACKKTWYCSAVCQKADWKARHKAACKR